MNSPNVQDFLEDGSRVEIYRVESYPPGDSDYADGWYVEAIDAAEDTVGMAGGQTEDEAMNALAWVLFNLQ